METEPVPDVNDQAGDEPEGGVEIVDAGNPTEEEGVQQAAVDVPVDHPSGEEQPTEDDVAVEELEDARTDQEADESSPSDPPQDSSQPAEPSSTSPPPIQPKSAPQSRHTTPPSQQPPGTLFAAAPIQELSEEEEEEEDSHVATVQTSSAGGLPHKKQPDLDDRDKYTVDDDAGSDRADSGWETDLDVSGILTRQNTQEPYLTACKTLGIVPVSIIVNSLKADELRMPYHGLGAKGAQALALVLEQPSSTLKVLDLTQNYVEEGGVFLGRALQMNRMLVHLDLSGNRLGFEGSHEIAEMLHFNGTLKDLILKDNKLSDREAGLFGEGLRQNSVLQVLDLSHNDIGDLGAIALGAGLASNDALKELNLGWNKIRHKGMAGMFGAIKDNLFLTTLNLESNGIGDNGAPVAAYLIKNNIIQNLNIRRTRCSDAAMVIIGKGVEGNYSLRELDASDNPWSDAGAQALFKGILNASSLRKVYIRNIKFTKTLRAKMDEIRAEKPECEIIEISEADALVAAKEARIRKSTTSDGGTT
ncbi:hypothetical protein DFS34DRAFT_269442 [Phlyctochytrium arcticum]|nr:hypothetical protein DFS34DRAFT_269442 [Phlyctochytrium arcticum]